MVLRAHARTVERPTSPTWAAVGAAVLSALVATTSFPTGAAAQLLRDGERSAGREATSAEQSEGKEEVLIGTFDLKPKPAPVPPPLPAPAGDTSSATAAGLYADALRMLQSGDQLSGQRQLELLVARFPSSGEARLARLRLARLYADPDPGRAGKAETAAAEAEPAAADTDGWSAEIRSRPSADEDHFRMEVGDRVFFVAGSAELGSRARSVLAAQAVWLQKQPHVDAIIEGHADDPGSTDENRAVAQARAEAVRQRLIQEGITPERLRVAVVGRSRRVAECDGAECATHNRRAVTIVYPRGAEPPGMRLGANGRGDGSTLSADLPATRRARR